MILSLFPSFFYIEAAAEEKQKPTAKDNSRREFRKVLTKLL